MCGSGRDKTWCRTCVINFNLARRPIPTQLQSCSPNPNHNPLGGSGSAGAATPPKLRASEIPASINQTRSLQQSFVLWGRLGSAGAADVFGWRFSKNTSGGRNTTASTDQTHSLQQSLVPTAPAAVYRASHTPQYRIAYEHLRRRYHEYYLRSSASKS